MTVREQSFFGIFGSSLRKDLPFLEMEDHDGVCMVVWAKKIPCVTFATPLVKRLSQERQTLNISIKWNISCHVFSDYQLGWLPGIVFTQFSHLFKVSQINAFLFFFFLDDFSNLCSTLCVLLCGRFTLLLSTGDLLNTILTILLFLFLMICRFQSFSLFTIHSILHVFHMFSMY